MSITLDGQRFDDLLADRRTQGDLSWVTREWSCPKYRFTEKRPPQKVKDEVYCSERVQVAISEVCKELSKERKEVEMEAKKIIEEMGHNMKMGNIRFLGYVLSKSYKSMYRSIFVNPDGMDKYRKISDKHPVLLLPTHRSYNDFLLLSYVCFYYNVPLPVIAAGLDFLGMPAVTMLLRNGGAFFIRRTFGSDKLYWAIFREYVHSVILGGEHSVEFFIEGTRSRSAKSLSPRTGLLQTALELFFTSQVSDITIIPVAITYDRTLEENLYAYELLGVPKPKESTSGLVKARGILRECYGNIFIKFGDPMSVRAFCDAKINRSLHSLHPRFLSHFTDSEVAVSALLAKYIIKQHHRILVLSPFPLMCLVYLYHHLHNGALLTVEQLANEVIWLKDLIERTGVLVYLEDFSAKRPTRWVQKQLDLHYNIFHKSSFDTIELVETIQSNTDQLPGSLKISSSMVQRALPQISLYHYGNQALQILAPFSMVALCSISCDSLPTHETMFRRYQELQKLLQREFVFEGNKLEEEFENAVQNLRSAKVLTLSGWEAEDDIKLFFIASLILPFLEALKAVCTYLLNRPESECDVSVQELVKRCQCHAEEDLKAGLLHDCRILSLDVLNNCLTCLCVLEAAKREKRNNKVVFMPDLEVVSRILMSVESFMPQKRAGHEKDCSVFHSPRAKL